jgi:hypothetical protein
MNSVILDEKTPIIVSPYYNENLINRQAERLCDNGFVETSIVYMLKGMCFNPILSPVQTTLYAPYVEEGMHADKCTVWDAYSVSKFGDYLPMEFILRHAEDIIQRYSSTSGGILFKTKPLPLPGQGDDGGLFISCIKKGMRKISALSIHAEIETTTTRIVCGLNVRQLY